MNIQSALTEGLNILKKRSILSAKLDSEILMAKALGKKREYIILNNYKIIKEQNLKYFKKLVQERATRKPIAYLLNKKFFWKNEFYVNNSSKDGLHPYTKKADNFRRRTGINASDLRQMFNNLFETAI